jgi:hypothetical protein
VTARIAVLFVWFSVVLLISACGGHLSGVVDFDNSRDFGSYKRFGFLEDEKPLERGQSEGRKLTRMEIEEQLKAKGYSITTPDQAHAIVIYHVGTRAKAHVSGAVGGGGQEASLAIEIRDPKSERSIWYGTVEQTWHEDLDAQERIHTAVKTLLDSYPPETKDLRKGTSSVEE